MITILNEMIGFFRDITDYEEGLKYTNILINLISKFSIDNYSITKGAKNIENAYSDLLSKATCLL